MKEGDLRCLEESYELEIPQGSSGSDAQELIQKKIGL